MSVPACEKFYGEKFRQASQVFTQRYAETVGAAEVTVTAWAEENEPELLAKYRKAAREMNALWSNGVFDEVFREQVLTSLRTMLEMCRLYDTQIRKGKAA